MSRRPVFVVDDDVSVRRALERLLRAAGYEVRAFASARELLARDDVDDAACVILDVRMPGQGGLELYEALVAGGRALSVIFMTGHCDIPMAVRAGAVDFLTKPISDEALLLAIDRAIADDERRRDPRPAERARPIAKASFPQVAGLISLRVADEDTSCTWPPAVSSSTRPLLDPAPPAAECSPRGTTKVS